MKLSHGIGLLTAALGTTALFVMGACGGSSSGSSGGDGGSGSGSGGATDNCSSLPSSACSPPPAAPKGAGATTHTAAHNYALHKLFLGDTDRNGVTSTTAWETFGYNLDGKITTASSTDVCTIAAGGSKTSQVDGQGGIDNSFGSIIVPILVGLDSTASQTLNTDINNGSFTIMTYVTGFDDSAGNTTSATGLNGLLLAGGNYGNLDAGAPAWNTTTHWPIVPTLLNGCNSTSGCPQGTDPLKSAQVTFPSAYQTGGTFVNGSPSTLTLNLSVGGQTISLDIASAVITFQPQAPGSVTGGVIAGVLDSNALVQALGSVAGNFGVCPGTSAFNSIANDIQQASDIILNNGAVSNVAGTPCNAISVGLGFESTEIAAPQSSDIEAPSTPGPSKCDGG